MRDLLILSERLIVAKERTFLWTELLTSMVREFGASRAVIQSWNPWRVVAEAGTPPVKEPDYVVPLSVAGLAIGELSVWFNTTDGLSRPEELKAFAAIIAVVLFSECFYEQTRLVIDGALHDIRGPLVRASNFGQLLLRDPALGDESAALARWLIDELLSLDPLIRSLGSFSPHTRATNGTVAVGAAVERALYELRAAIQTHSAVVICEIEDNLAIEAEEIELTEVFRQLTQNSLRFSQRGVEIAIRARRQLAGALIIFSDNGPGVPSTDVERAFRPFQRLHAGTTIGHGLGLTIARNLVQRMGGWIRIQPCEERGTYVNIWLPVREASAI